MSDRKIKKNHEAAYVAAETSVNDKVARVATTTSSAIDYNTSPKSSHISNPQLNAWIDAGQRYSEVLKKNHYNWEDVIPIVSSLGNSLAYLFGMTYTNPGNTPALRSFVESEFEKGWDLKKEPQLYHNFIKLDDYYKDITKHMSRHKINKAANVTLNDLKLFMETTRQMWLWFMNKVFNGKIPPAQLRHFQEKYI